MMLDIENATSARQAARMNTVQVTNQRINDTVNPNLKLQKYISDQNDYNDNKISLARDVIVEERGSEVDRMTGEFENSNLPV